MADNTSQLPKRRVAEGFETSVMGVGTWQFGCKGEEDYWGLRFDQPLATSVIKACVEKGVNYIDTAEVYGDGESEQQVGQAILDLGLNRDSVIIGSKIGPQHCGDVEKYLTEALARMQCDYVDLYMVHWPMTANAMAHFTAHDMFDSEQGDRDDTANEVSGPSPVEIAFRDLKRMQDAGKIKHIGVSNFGVKQLEEALATGVKIAVNQVAYNLISRAVEFEILPFCEENDISVFAYSPLLQGILTGKWKNADEIPEFRARSTHFNGQRNRSRHGESGHEELVFATLQKIREIADRENTSMASLALQWPLHRDVVKCVICGFSKPEQVDRNLVAYRTEMSAELAQELNAATEELKQAMGKNCDLWQGAHDSRIE